MDERHHDEEAHVTIARRAGEHWQIDKKIPMALVLLILIQTGGAVWWAASTDGRVTRLEAQSTEAGSVKIV